MRKLILAVTAVTMAVPVVPMSAASAQSGYYNGRVWRDSNGRMRCRRSSGCAV